MMRYISMFFNITAISFLSIGVNIVENNKLKFIEIVLIISNALCFIL